MPLKRRKMAKPWRRAKKLPDFAAGEKTNTWYMQIWYYRTKIRKIKDLAII